MSNTLYKRPLKKHTFAINCLNVRFLGFFFVFFSFFGCASAQKAVLFNEIFDKIEDITPIWQYFDDGIDILSSNISNPKLKIHALRVDLSNPSVKIVLNKASEPVNSIQSIKVSTFLEKYNLRAAVNASPFDKVGAKENIPLQNSGIFISDGILVSPPIPNNGALIFYRNNSAAIVNQSDIQNKTFNISDIENAAGGFYEVLKNGEVLKNPGSTRHPRTAAGLSSDGNILYLLVIDGRQLTSIGATETEIGRILLALGARDGLNFDGGGSSTLAVKSGNKTRIVNTPIHGGIPGRERAVSVCIGIR